MIRVESTITVSPGLTSKVIGGTTYYNKITIDIEVEAYLQKQTIGGGFNTYSFNDGRYTQSFFVNGGSSRTISPGNNYIATKPYTHAQSSGNILTSISDTDWSLTINTNGCKGRKKSSDSFTSFAGTANNFIIKGSIIKE